MWPAVPPLKAFSHSHPTDFPQSAGIPQALLDLTVVVPFNDPDALDAALADPEREEFLERLNAWLVLHADAEHRQLAETVPTLHVIGAPRSGTTLLHQALVSRLDLGYVDNLVCTTLLEEDGQQLLTLTIGIPSAAQEDGYRFFVPGVDSAELELVVP